MPVPRFKNSVSTFVFALHANDLLFHFDDRAVDCFEDMLVAVELQIEVDIMWSYCDKHGIDPFVYSNMC